MTFFTEALAQEATPQADPAHPEGGVFQQFVPLILVALVFYFLLIRPQQKRLKEHQQLIESLRRGDKVITAGGIHGIITKVEPETDVAHVEIAENVVVKVARSTISNVINRTLPADVANDSSGEEKAAKGKNKKKS